LTQPASFNSCQPSDGQPLQETVQPPLTLAGSQLAVDQWIQSIGVRYFSELTNLAQLMEEVGELSRVISRTYGEQSFKPSEQPSDLSDELADVLFVLICLANQCGVDLEQALRRNLKKKTDRDSTRHKFNPKLDGTLKSNRNSEQS
jgi:NTP pyrophosphatase (non-canonical NTP hydrolase)